MSLSGLGAKILNGVNTVKSASVNTLTASNLLSAANQQSTNSGNSGGGGSVTSTASIMDQNNIYAVQFLSNDYRGQKIAVVGYLPENFNVQIGSEYSQPFMELAPSSLAQGAGLGIVSGVLGASGSIQAMSVKVWQGSQGLTMSVPMTFVAETDPQENTDKIMQLLSLCTPSAPEGVFGPLLPPGPNYGGLDKLQKLGSIAADAVKTAISDSVEVAAKQAGDKAAAVIREGMKNVISVELGTYMFFESVVVDNVDVDFQNLLAPASMGGRPWKVDATVQFSTLWNPSIEDLRKIFRLA